MSSKSSRKDAIDTPAKPAICADRVEQRCGFIESSGGVEGGSDCSGFGQDLLVPLRRRLAVGKPGLQRGILTARREDYGHERRCRSRSAVFATGGDCLGERKRLVPRAPERVHLYALCE